MQQVYDIESHKKTDLKIDRGVSHHCEASSCSGLMSLIKNTMSSMLPDEQSGSKQVVGKEEVSVRVPEAHRAEPSGFEYEGK